MHLLTLNMETEVSLITSAAWAINNLAHGSQLNVDTILKFNGIELLLRIVKGAEVR